MTLAVIRLLEKAAFGWPFSWVLCRCCAMRAAAAGVNPHLRAGLCTGQMRAVNLFNYRIAPSSSRTRGSIFGPAGKTGMDSCPRSGRGQALRRNDESATSSSRTRGSIFSPTSEISVKLADKPDSVRLPFLRNANVTAINLGRGSPRRLNATYPPALRNHINAGLLGIAARRDCPFHPD